MLTAEQRTQRRHHIGSSDAAAILGLDPFRTARDVFWEKVGPEIPDEDKPEYAIGNLLEDAICAYGGQRLGKAITRNVYRVAEDGIAAANLDAVVAGEREAIEAKYSGDADQWGAEGTDEVPERVLVQCQHQAYVGGFERVWVPALVIGYRAEFRLYCVPRHDELIEKIVDEEQRFWREHVEAKCPPDQSAVPPLRFLKHARREARSLVDLAEEALGAWVQLEAAKAAARRADEAKDEAAAAVLALLGDAEAGRLPDGRTITYFEQKSPPRCDLTQLRALHPAAYEQLVTQGMHRTLRIKAGNGTSTRRKGD